MPRRSILPLLLLAAPLVAADPPAKPKTPWANKLFVPGIADDPAQPPPPVVAHDFGTVPANTVCSHTFPLTNIYDVPMQVVDVRVECGCLKAFPPNKVLQPNERGEFTVTMNTALFKGPATKRMLVTVGLGHSDRGADGGPVYVSTAELKLTAAGREDVSVSAPGLIDFGIVPEGSRAEKSVTVKYTGKGMKDWKVESWEVSGAGCTAEVVESARGFLSTDYKITVALKGTAAPGPLADAVILKTNDPAAPTVAVAIGGSVRPPVTACPEKVVFDAAAKEPQAQRVLVKAVAACKVSGVADAGDGVSVDPAPQPRPTELNYVWVRYEPKKPGELRRVVRVKTDLPGSPEAVIEVEVR